MPECPFYMKSGKCQFGSACEFRHPKEHSTTKVCLHHHIFVGNVFMIIDVKIQFGTWERMLLPSKNNILKCQKILKKNFALTSQQSMCARQVSRKTDIFCGLCKKDKRMSHTKPFFNTKFCIFTHDTKKVVFS
jgi:hypothetical protein